MPPYPPELKRQVIELVRAGRSLAGLSREFGPAPRTIKNWVRQANRNQGRQKDGLTSHEREELLAIATRPTSRIQVKKQPFGEKIMTKESFEKNLSDLLNQAEIDGHAKGALQKNIGLWLDQLVSEEDLKNKLEILFEYERHYLELIKEYKEEIKFSASLQEDLRRERSQFFTQILREVSETLKNADVDSKVASQWTQDLVDSYTKSIELSSDLAKTHAIDVIGKLRESTKAEVQSLIEKNEE